MIREQNLQVTDAPNMAYDAVLTAGNFKPILFSTPMVQAILRGEKTQTRRIIKPEPDIKKGSVIEPCNHYKGFDFIQKKLIGTNPDRFEIITAIKCKYKVGDILWVRETFQILPPNMVFYKADTENKATGNWKPSIFMPKEACRFFLKIKGIKIERLNDISESDAKAEGVETLDLYPGYNVSNRGKYEGLWNLINGNGSWDKNPFVWVYEFERTDASFACS